MKSENVLENVRLGRERALYASKNLILRNVSFDGEEDGESAVKECENIQAYGCYCNLRYPFWHVKKLGLYDCELTPLCRAALWYSEDVTVLGTRMNGIKALRECRNVRIENCKIASDEFGWSTKNVSMRDACAESEYFMLRSRRLNFKNVVMKGKYSFQYIEDGVFEDCSFDTKDAFWHAKNVTVRNCVVKGEYLGWYSENLTFIGCTISGTQPLCYCKGLKLIGCKMTGADLCFEKSEVQARILTHVDSVKNPYAGEIALPSVGEIIRDDERALAEIVLTDADGAR